VRRLKAKIWQIGTQRYLTLTPRYAIYVNAEQGVTPRAKWTITNSVIDSHILLLSGLVDIGEPLYCYYPSLSYGSSLLKELIVIGVLG
jgi:hypothetical protein